MKLSFLLLAFILVGCKRPMKNPELIDPIYTDLLKESKVYLELSSKFLAEAEATKVELEKEDPRTGNAKAIKNRYYGKLRDAENAKQMQVYYELHARSRKREARESYLKAFLADKPWPDPSEYEGYQTQVALRKANRSWDARAKKWSSRLAEIKKGAPSGGGEKSESSSAPSAHH